MLASVLMAFAASICHAANLRAPLVDQEDPSLRKLMTRGIRNRNRNRQINNTSNRAPGKASKADASSNPVSDVASGLEVSLPIPPASIEILMADGTVEATANASSYIDFSGEGIDEVGVLGGILKGEVYAISLTDVIDEGDSNSFGSVDFDNAVTTENIVVGGVDKGSQGLVDLAIDNGSFDSAANSMNNGTALSLHLVGGDFIGDNNAGSAGNVSTRGGGVSDVSTIGAGSSAYATATGTFSVVTSSSTSQP
jgi:hypothetical protein